MSFIFSQITVTVHDPVEVKKDADRAELRKKCDDIIYSVLPPVYHGVKGANTKVEESEKKEN